VFLEGTPRRSRQYSIGTWNVRTLNQGGKLENLKKEMEKNGVSVMGVSEVRWKGQGEIRSGDYTMYYSGGEKCERGVAIVVHKSIVGSVVKKIVWNDRIIAVKLNAKPVNILIVQVYMPTSDYEDEEVDEYNNLSKCDKSEGAQLVLYFRCDDAHTQQRRTIEVLSKREYLSLIIIVY
jgi:exonuclease III